jgi:hypothetical protein
MSHLHRMRAANLAIAGDQDTTHTCRPTIVAADGCGHLEETAPPPPSSPKKRAPKKAKASKRAKR